jgi:hypothetical protein
MPFRAPHYRLITYLNGIEIKAVHPICTSVQRLSWMNTRTQIRKHQRTKMPCSQNAHRAGDAYSPLIVNNLCAQLIPLNRYGPPNLGAAAVDGLRLLIGVSRKAVGAALHRSESSHELAA